MTSGGPHRGYGRTDQEIRAPDRPKKLHDCTRDSLSVRTSLPLVETSGGEHEGDHAVWRHHHAGHPRVAVRSRRQLNGAKLELRRCDELGLLRRGRVVWSAEREPRGVRVGGVGVDPGDCCLLRREPGACDGDPPDVDRRRVGAARAVVVGEQDRDIGPAESMLSSWNARMDGLGTSYRLIIPKPPWKGVSLPGIPPSSKTSEKVQYE